MLKITIKMPKSSLKKFEDVLRSTMNEKFTREDIVRELLYIEYDHLEADERTNKKISVKVEDIIPFV